MSSLRNSLLVLLCVGVAAPAAARPRGSAAAFPGVSDVLLNLNLAAPVPAVRLVLDAASWRLNADHAVGLRATSLWPCSDFNLVRLFAGHGWFDDPSDEVNTSQTVEDQAAPGGSASIVYHKSDLEVGDGCDTLYITITGVGEITSSDTQDGGLELGCFVDNSPCLEVPPSFPDNDFDPGWVGVFSDVRGSGLDTGGDADFGASVPVTYTWCLPITPGTHDVRLNLASGESGLDVSLSKVWVYVDASFTSGQCVTEFSAP